MQSMENEDIWLGLEAEVRGEAADVVAGLAHSPEFGSALNVLGEGWSGPLHQ